MARRIWILGAPDPEMEAIETLLRERGETVLYALTADGRRVAPGSMYSAQLGSAIEADVIYEVECMIADRSMLLSPLCVTIDHHRPGDPGYGRPPEEFLAASSLGQVLEVLGVAVLYAHRDEHGLWDGMPLPATEPSMSPRDAMLIAAADHCLGAAYAGKCPGVDPEELGRFRATERARFQSRFEPGVTPEIVLQRIG